jgi:hypothetical protein
MSKKAQLSEKHWKAIELIAEGQYTIKEIAKMVDLAPCTLYALYEGDDSAGGTGKLFQAEVKKITQKSVKRIKDYFVTNKVTALKLMDEFLKRKVATGYVSDDDIKSICTVYNALTKTVGVEINNNTSISYFKGLSTEELMHEYNRLRSLTEGTSVRRAVSDARSGSARGVLELAADGSGHNQESEAS